MQDAQNTVVYVGKAKNLQVRIKQYFIPGRDERACIPLLRLCVKQIQTIITTSEKEALLLENTLIKKHQPKYNILLKDDKTYACLTINHQHPYPQLRLMRYKGKPKKGVLYFGPYTNAMAAKQTLELMHRLFRLRQCSDSELTQRTRPCLLFEIKRCLAPCVHKCTDEEYSGEVTKAVQFLKGQDKQVVEKLKEEIALLSNAMEFEKAMELHTLMQQITYVQDSRKALVHSKIKDCDVFHVARRATSLLIMQLVFREGRLVGAEPYFFPFVADTDEEALQSFLMQHYLEKEKIPKEIVLPFPLPNLSILKEFFENKLHFFVPQKGEKKALVLLAQKNALSAIEQQEQSHRSQEELLLQLQDKLFLSKCPLHLVCFDISTTANTDTVASAVTFRRGVRCKKTQKTYKIQTKEKGDYSAMQEVLLRYLKRAQAEEDLPDLIIIDGGKGHLNLAVSVLKALDIISVEAIAIAKENSKHDKGLTKERVFSQHPNSPFSLNVHDTSLQFLQSVRDQAHRVAITHHKKRRSKQITSSLASIPGIGPVKRKRLLQRFGSITQIKTASEQAILSVPGITKKDYAAIVQFISIDK